MHDDNDVSVSFFAASLSGKEWRLVFGVGMAPSGLPPLFIK